MINVISYANIMIVIQLKKARQTKKISLRALGEKSKVHYTTIARIEAGRISPTIGTLKKLAKALGITLEELIKERG